MKHIALVFVLFLFVAVPSFAQVGPPLQPIGDPPCWGLSGDQYEQCILDEGGGGTPQTCPEVTSYNTCTQNCTCNFNKSKQKCKSNPTCVDLAVAEKNACLGNCIADWF